MLKPNGGGPRQVVDAEAKWWAAKAKWWGANMSGGGANASGGAANAMTGGRRRLLVVGRVEWRAAESNGGCRSQMVGARGEW